jgi:hypothetical protein
MRTVHLFNARERVGQARAWLGLAATNGPRHRKERAQMLLHALCCFVDAERLRRCARASGKRGEP